MEAFHITWKELRRVDPKIILRDMFSPCHSAKKEKEKETEEERKAGLYLFPLSLSSYGKTID
jgi:hypothetical protein